MDPASALFIIDGIGPFFRDCLKAQINWSKIDFTLLEKNNRPDPAICARIEAEFTRFTQRAAAMGYNAVTLDDLAHLICCPAYSPELNEKIKAWRVFYRRLFRIAHAAGMQVLITTDLLFFNPALDALLGLSFRRAAAFVADCCRRALHDFEEIGGIVFRFGETDGVDVEGDFRSRMIIHCPDQARRLLKQLLPVFESRQRLLIFRTWSVGIGPIGDLIWNRHTFDRVFDGIDSLSLVISMKYGQSDFFRYLPLNQLFFHSPHRKIIELQARREYEGFGEFPSFTGWDYERFRKQLISARGMCGICVWCQTGGWSGFRRLTLLDESGIWNEINTFTTLKIFREKMTAEQAIQQFHREKFGHPNWQPLHRLLRLSDEVIKELLYMDDFATRQIFFRRLRVPPLLAVYWNHILVNPAIRHFLHAYVSNGETCLEEGRRTLEKIHEMQQLARECGLPEKDLEFQYDTFELIAAAREYFFRPLTDELIEKLWRLKIRYEDRWPAPQRYTLLLDLNRLQMRCSTLRLMRRLFFRARPGYRLADRLLTLSLLTLCYPLLRRLIRNRMPVFASEQAMGLHTVLK